MSNKYDDLIKKATQSEGDEPKTHADKRAAGWRRFNVLLSPAEHRAYKVACLEEEIDMSDQARDLILAWMKERRSK